MGSNQLYSLTWGEFGTSLVSAVQLLRCHGDLTDVTLAAGGRSFPAHKIVLCAASPFLLNLLKSTPCQHPVVMLAGVTAQDLEALLEFMYRGEVSVDPNQLPSLLQAAHCLNIQGLAPGTISAEKNEDAPSLPGPHEALTRDVINSFLPIRRRKRTKRRNSTGSGGKWPRQDGMGVDAENRPMEQHVPGVAPPEQNTLNMPNDASHRPDDAEGTQAQDAEGTQAQSGDEPSMTKKNGVSDQPATCPLCGAIIRQSRNLRRHLELLHFGVGRSIVRVRTRKPPQQQPPASERQPQQQQQQNISGTETSSQSNLHNASPPPPPPPPIGSLLMPVTSHQQMIPVDAHILPLACQNSSQRLQRQEADLQERPPGLCEPAAVLGCMLPTMAPSHDPVFRQHHADFLRGAGLYPDARVPTGVARTDTAAAMRQEVA